MITLNRAQRACKVFDKAEDCLYGDALKHMTKYYLMTATCSGGVVIETRLEKRILENVLLYIKWNQLRVLFVSVVCLPLCPPW